MAISTRQGLIDYALRSLGHPVIEINIDEDQMEDRVDDAIQYFQEYNSDGTEKIYLKYQITQTDIDNCYIDLTASGVTGNVSTEDVSQAPTESGKSTRVPIENSIMSVLGLFHISSSSFSMFDIRYQYVLNDLYTLGSINLQHYYITQEYISLLGQMLSPDKRLRFNRRKNRLYIDSKLSYQIRPGDYIIIEAYRILDPTVYPEVYNDILLKRYVTALFKRQWGQNLSKFQNVQLPGGIVLNGAEILSQALLDIQEIEETVINKYGPDLDFFVG